MQSGLRDRVAIVAASSSGLGRAVAEALAAEGAQLALCSRNRERIERAAEELRRRHAVRCLAEAVDVTDASGVEAFVREVQRHFSRIDICVTNAGGPPSREFLATTPEEWRSATEMNFFSHLHFARYVLPVMRQARWGRFLMITSVAVKQPIEGLILSNAVRSAVLGLTRSLANEFGRDNILVNNVCPGYTLTERLAELGDARARATGATREAIYADWARHTALGRLADPREFADLVVFLASERASYITGQSILVDGGYYKGV